MLFKIIHVSASYKPAFVYGGPIFSVSKLCEGLVNGGTEVEVLTTTANGKVELPVSVSIPQLVDSVKVTYFKRLTKDHTHFSPSLYTALYAKLDRKFIQTSHKQLNKSTTKQSAIVHIHAWWNLVSIFACLVAKLRSVPVVLSPRGTLSSYSFGNRNRGIKKYIHQFLGRTLLNYCHFHVTSEIEKQGVLDLLTPLSITVIPNFVQLPELGGGCEEVQRSELGVVGLGFKVESEELGVGSEEVQSSESKVESEKLGVASEEVQSSALEVGSVVLKVDSDFKLLFLSRVEEKKGLDILFSALAKVDFSYSLTIGGTGENHYISNLKQLAIDLRISERISWLGLVGQEEKWNILRDHDLLVLPSHNENFANVIVECLSMGTPVVVSKNVGLVDYVTANNFGWVCDTSPDSVANSLTRAFWDPLKRGNIRKEAPVKIRKDFDEKVLVRRYTEMYHTLI